MAAGGSGSERAWSGRHVDRMLAQHVQWHHLQRPFVGRRQDHERGHTVSMRPQPVPGSDTPAVAGTQPGKSKLGSRRGEIVPDPPLMLQEFGGHHGTDGVAPDVLRSGSATAIAGEPGERIRAAGLQITPEDVAVVRPPVVRPSVAHLRSIAQLPATHRPDRTRPRQSTPGNCRQLGPAPVTSSENAPGRDRGCAGPSPPGGRGPSPLSARETAGRACGAGPTLFPG